MPVDKHTFTTRPFHCTEDCDYALKVLGWDYDVAPECPTHGASMELDFGQFGKAPGVIPDDIPGGILIRHGLCNPDGSPRRYDSRSAMKAEGERRGLQQHVEHMPERGSDKSKHTTRWV
jgi:hypothetical protein